MLKNYVVVALRNLRSNVGFAFINVTGLALGLACFTLIVLFVQNELSYDRYHKNAENIYRIEVSTTSPQGVQDAAQTPPFWIPDLVDEIPEIVSAVRMKPPRQKWMVRYEDKVYSEKLWTFADASIFDIFDIPLIQGNPESALVDPDAVVISESTAKKYFGENDPMGKVISLDSQYDLTVSGVMRDTPETSHFHYDFLASFVSLQDPNRYYLTNALTAQFPFSYTYLLLENGADAAGIAEKMRPFIESRLPAGFVDQGISIDPRLTALTDIHLRSHLADEVEANGSLPTVLIFIAIAIFVLLIASVNFMNLATAKSAGRAREVGVRKVMGAEKFDLILQFLGESVMISGIALVFALALAAGALPVFNNLTGKSFLYAELFSPMILIMLVAVTAIVGLVSGSYPAFFLSAFQPAAVLKGTFKAKAASGFSLRDGLVVFQFAISIMLIIATAVVYQQMSFVSNQPLGFDKEQVLVVQLTDPTPTNLYPVFRDRIVQHPKVLSVSAANGTPGGLNQEFRTRPINADADESWVSAWYAVDFEFTETLGIEMAAGRPLQSGYSTDSTAAIMINESAATAYGFTNPEDALDQEIEIIGFNGFQSRIVGVTKDFHIKSVHERVGPITMSYFGNFHFFAFVRLQMDDLDETLSSLEQSWNELLPGYLFEYSFLDEDFDQLYRSEAVLQTLLEYFALLTVFIACLGLFGLASFAAEQRTKEIGIRKTMGATVPGVAYLLTRDLARLVVPAFIIAAPLSYYLMQEWLNSFAYSTSIGIGIFVVTFVSAISIASLTVGYKAVKAASANPVDSLRYE